MTSLSSTVPATTWLERFPLGDGTIGAMIDAQDPVTCIGLNHEHLWSGNSSRELLGTQPDLANVDALQLARDRIDDNDPAGAQTALMSMQSRWCQAFLPVGTLLLHRKGPSDGGPHRRELDLTTAVHRTWRSRNLTSPERAMVSEPFHTLVVEADDLDHLSLETELTVLSMRRDEHELLAELGAPLDVAPPHEPNEPGVIWPDDVTTTIRAVVHARIVWTGARPVVFATITTTFDNLGQPLRPLVHARQEAADRLEQAVNAGVEAVFQAGTASHARLFERCAVTFDKTDSCDDPTKLSLDRRLANAFNDAEHPLRQDPGLAGLLFDFGRYLLVSSSRPGTLPPTLQGIWNEQLRPPWSSNYTLNINTQMNHWASHVTNLPETAEPLRDFVTALAGAGSRTAKRLYNTSGWVAHHNSDIWLFSSPVGGGRGDARWAHWPMAGAWLTRSLWDAVAFGAGKDEAERVWPIARRSAEFLLEWQRETASGWSTAPATSPENTYLAAGAEVAVAAGTAMDDQLVVDCLNIVGDLASVLGKVDDPVATAAARRLSEIDDSVPETFAGTVREWVGAPKEADPQHRHVSHLFGLFPGAGRWNYAARRAAERTLERRGNESTGWSLAWKAALWARLGRGDVVQELLALLFRDANSDRGPEAGGLYPNLFAAHPPFQIDANLAFPAVIAECLLQSHNGIELLPALPSTLANGSARGLVARPGVEVDLRWADSALIEATFRADSPLLLTIRYRGSSVERRISGTVVLSAADLV